MNMSRHGVWITGVIMLLLVATLLLLFADDIDGEGLVAFPWHAL